MSSSVEVFDWEILPNYSLCGFSPVDSDEVRLFEIYQTVSSQKNQVWELLDYVQNKWLVGYNSRSYDNILLQFLLTVGDKFLNEPTPVIAKTLYKISNDIIKGDYQKNKWNLKGFRGIDLMRVGNIKKSLKLVGVDLGWPLVQDMPHPHDKPIIESDIPDLQFYNKNDLGITNQLYNYLKEEIIMRQKLTVKYGTDLMDYADSGLADRLLSKFYSKATGLSYWDFKDLKTERSKVKIQDCIPENIYFRTEKMKSFLKEIKQEELSVRDKFRRSLRIGDTRYDMAKGGLHSNRDPEIFSETDQYLLSHPDVSSYYPNHMINNRVKPAHLREEFLDVLEDALQTRLKAKYEEDTATDVGLKRTVNSVFGKTGFYYSWMYDLQAMYGTTIPCQLFLLMFIERLEEDNFPVIYANTDGLIVKVNRDRVDRYKEICQSWQDETRFELDYEDIEKAVVRDVNNYLIFKKDGKIKMKGEFDTERHKDPEKGYDCPIVSIAVKQYYQNGVLLEETIQTHDNILDFCMAQKVGGKFDVVFQYNDNGKLAEQETQKTNRYYVGKGGGSLLKRSDKSQIRLVAGDPVVLLNEYDQNRPISSYNIKYRYYIRRAYDLINQFKHKQMSLL